ncbi:hypothetical protein [Roseateles sp. L2-2]|uniref:hypothetical protein n=1 Tax=Roseateles TaxID=93681 RepID=UPI003D35AF1E
MKASTSAPFDLNTKVPVQRPAQAWAKTSVEAPSPERSARLRELFEAAPQTPRPQRIKERLAHWFGRLRPQAARPQA